jgi:aminoglycoside N3'-acetyltransferase
MPGVRRSLHPTHSICALGPLADDLTAAHHLASTRTGKGTPFELMAQKKTIIAGLGVEYFRCMTQTDTAEDMLGDEFPVRFESVTVPVTVIDWEERKVPYNLTINRTSMILDNALLRSLLSKSELKEWKYKGTPMFMTFADKVTERLIEAARNGITVYRPGKGKL